MRIADIVRDLFRPQFGSILSAIGSGIGIFNGLNNLSNSGGSYNSNTGSGSPSFYQPGGVAGADQTWQNMLAQIFAEQSGVTQSVNPAIYDSYIKSLGIDTSGIGAAGQAAGQAYGNLANTAAGYSQGLGQVGSDMFGAGKDIYNLARDPQNQMHDFLQNQVVDQSRAGSSARGLGMSPYAAGLENDATTKFNMGWQDNLLGRANTGLTAMENANRTGATDWTGSMAMGGMVPQYQMQAAGTPVQAQQVAAGWPGQAASTYAGQVGTSVNAPMQAIMAQIMPYLNYGQGATNSAYTGFANQQAYGNQQQTQGLERILGGMQNLGGNSGAGGWLSGFTNPGAGGSVDPYGNPYGNFATSGSSGGSPYGVGSSDYGFYG